MKKSYKKPKICFESFALSDAISSGCKGISNLGENQCVVFLPDGDFTVYNIDLVCEFTPEDGLTVCYHVPSENNNVFSS